MSDSHHHEHQEDNSVNVKVALFFVAALVSIIFISWIN